MTQRDCYDCYYSKLGGEKEPCKSCKSTDEGFTNWREVQPTNADRIRAMSDEELARFLASVEYRRAANGGGAKWCGMAHALKWLQQPAEEDDHG